MAATAATVPIPARRKGLTRSQQRPYEWTSRSRHRFAKRCGRQAITAESPRLHASTTVGPASRTSKVSPAARTWSAGSLPLVSQTRPERIETRPPPVPSATTWPAGRARTAWGSTEPRNVAEDCCAFIMATLALTRPSSSSLLEVKSNETQRID